MRKQIVQIFHNLRGKVNSSSEQPGYESGGQDGLNESSTGHGLDVKRDVLTELPDRKSFEKIVDRELSMGTVSGCLIIGDVDRFKEINDIYGYDIGDDVLRYVVHVLRECFGERGFITRQGSDIFALWLPEVSSDHGDRLRRQVGMVNDRLLHPAAELPPVTLSVGIAFGDSKQDCRNLGRNAVKALNRVKESGRCGCEIYDF